MAGSLVVLARQSPLNGGTTVAGAQLFVYEAGTTTKRAVYTTSALSVQHSNPVVADSNGRFAAVWVNPTGGAYKIVLAPSGDSDPPTSPFWTEDNIPVVLDDSQLSSNVPLKNTANTFTGIQTVSAAIPSIRLNETGVTANNALWEFGANAEALLFSTINDAASASATWLTVQRTGTVVDSITFSATNVFLGANAGVGSDGTLFIKDGVTAPSTSVGFALIYVDTADGDLKVKFGDGTVKTLATDT